MDLAYAQWTQVTTHLNKPDANARTTYWIRTSPPAWAWRTEQGVTWSQGVVDERGHLHTDSHRKDCLIYPAYPPFTSDDLVCKVVAPEPPGGPIFEETLDTLKVRFVFLKLKRVLRYDWEVIRNNFRIHYQVWADPKSRRLVRKEKREFNLLSGQEVYHEVCERYIYNRKPPAGTFEMPSGKPIVEASGDAIRSEIRNPLSD